MHTPTLVLLAFVSVWSPAVTYADDIAPECKKEILKAGADIYNQVNKPFAYEIKQQKIALKSFYKKIKRHAKYDRDARALLSDAEKFANPKNSSSASATSTDGVKLLDEFASFAIIQESIVQNVRCPKNLKSIVKLDSTALVTTSGVSSSVELAKYFKATCAGHGQETFPTEDQRLGFNFVYSGSAELHPALTMCGEYLPARTTTLKIKDAFGAAQELPVSIPQICVVKDLRTGDVTVDPMLLVVVQDKSGNATVANLIDVLYEALKDKILACNTLQAFKDEPKKRSFQKTPAILKGNIAI